LARSRLNLSKRLRDRGVLHLALAFTLRRLTFFRLFPRGHKLSGRRSSSIPDGRRAAAIVASSPRTTAAAFLNLSSIPFAAFLFSSFFSRRLLSRF